MVHGTRHCNEDEINLISVRYGTAQHYDSSQPARAAANAVSELADGRLCWRWAANLRLKLQCRCFCLSHSGHLPAGFIYSERRHLIGHHDMHASCKVSDK